MFKMVQYFLEAALRLHIPLRISAANLDRSDPSRPTIPIHQWEGKLDAISAVDVEGLNMERSTGTSGLRPTCDDAVLHNSVQPQALDLSEGFGMCQRGTSSSVWRDCYAQRSLS